MFVDAAAELPKATRLMLDAKCDYPAACNALETLLVHKAHLGGGGGKGGSAAKGLLDAARGAGIKLFGGPRACAALGLEAAPSMRHEYGELAMCVEVVDGVAEAVAHINAHGSGHTDVVVTEDAAVAAAFMQGVDAANVFHNCSSRFMVRVAVLGAPCPATTGSSDCVVRRLEAALRTRKKRPGASDHRRKRWLFSHTPLKSSFHCV